ncbi:MAG: aldo/keto reductase [Microbacteriaceae bacterium]|jgi:2,5-diketo-D-gluconate reductase A|nr:aldo/keto reductase [Microbacteriaceae bacterium]
MTFPVNSISLNDGTSIPQLGLGTYRLDDDDAYRVTAEAFAVGYRHIDTARIYKNEKGVGRAIRESGIPRDDLYITTKLWNGDQPKARDAISSSLDRLGLEHVDLYLIHWPAPQRGTYVEAWKQLEVLQQDGLTTSIGVSNFEPEHLDAIAAVSDIVPVLNQVELHPLFQQKDLRAEHAQRGIATESWGPLGHGSVDLGAEIPALANLAARYNKTIAQVVLRWHIQEGLIIFPKTSHQERLVENFAIFDFAISADDMDMIRGCDVGHRVGAAPADGNWD